MIGISDSFRVPRSCISHTHQYMREEILQALDPVLFGLPSQADEVRFRLEHSFAIKMEQRYSCAVHSGTIGLFLALRACGVGASDEVITVANSDISTTAAISHSSATPVLCDVQETDYTISPLHVESLVTERTKAILPVDLYGHPADVKCLRGLANKFGLKIVEDATLATGAYDHGRPVGSFADVTVHSFGSLKPLGGIGNGAMVTTDDEGIARRLRVLCGYGCILDSSFKLGGYRLCMAEGYNVPLDPLQAALLTVKLAYLNEWTEKRRMIAAAYARGLEDTGVLLPQLRDTSSPTFRSYTIRVKDQQSIYHGLRHAGIEAVIHYAPPIHKQPVYRGRLPGSNKLPVTERLTREIVCLPVAPELTDEDIRLVIDTVRDLL